MTKSFSKCTRCRCRKIIIFDREYSFTIVSGLEGPPEKYHIKLCASCLINFARTQIMEININQVKSLAGLGRPLGV